MNRKEDFSNFEFVGKKLEDVQHFYDLTFRIKMKDGEAYFGTCDYKPNRYNFVVDNGIITAVSMG
jgi:hypothetical protein